MFGPTPICGIICRKIIR